MAQPIRLIAEPKKARTIEPRAVTCYRIVGPWRIEAQREVIASVPAGCVLVRPLVTGICHADLRYLSGSRPPEVLRARLPMAPFHEGAAQIVELGPGLKRFQRGQRVVVVPNIPCYLHDPWRYPSRRKACIACKPGGGGPAHEGRAGENFCADVRFLASNCDGMARTAFVQPAQALLPLDDAISDEIAALSEPLAVAWAAIEPMAPRPQDYVAVLGTGVMGFLVALLLSRAWRTEKKRLICTDVMERRLEKVADFARTLNVREQRPDELEGRLDIVFECAGGKASAATIARALELLRPGGRCMLLGVSEEPVPVPTRRMLDKGLTLRGTTRSALRHFKPVLQLLRDAVFQRVLRRVVHPRIFTADCADSLVAAARAAADPQGAGKVLLRWPQQKGER